MRSAAVRPGERMIGGHAVLAVDVLTVRSVEICPILRPVCDPCLTGP
jgi:hypothetical protein